MLTEVQNLKENGEKSSVSGASQDDILNAPVTVHVSVGNFRRDFTPLYWVRTEKGLSIPELSALSGVTRWQIQGYESGLTEPRIGQAFKLAMALNVSVDFLFGIPYKRMARQDQR